MDNEIGDNPSVDRSVDNFLAGDIDGNRRYLGYCGRAEADVVMHISNSSFSLVVLTLFIDFLL